jgi:hypothetical protein
MRGFLNAGLGVSSIRLQEGIQKTYEWIEKEMMALLMPQ